MTSLTGKYPALRMRRMRKEEFSRRLMREHRLSKDDLIYPLFVIDGKNRTVAVDSMPGVQRYTVDRLLRHAETCVRAGSPAIALFPAIERSLKTADGREAFNPKGLVPRAVTALKKRFPELGVITDAALDPYTTHGHDGILDRQGQVLNDETVAVLEKQALVCAAAGVDVVAPSDMMDGVKRFLAPAIDGRRQVLLAGREAESIHPNGWTTSAALQGEEYFLSGAKQLSASPQPEDFFVVFAKTEQGFTAFLLDADRDDIEVRKNDHPCLILRKCKTTKDAILGEVGTGFYIGAKRSPTLLDSNRCKIRGPSGASIRDERNLCFGLDRAG